METMMKFILFSLLLVVSVFANTDTPVYQQLGCVVGFDEQKFALNLTQFVSKGDATIDGHTYYKFRGTNGRYVGIHLQIHFVVPFQLLLWNTI